MAVVLSLDAAPAALRTSQTRRKPTRSQSEDHPAQFRPQALPFPLLSPDRQQTSLYRVAKRDTYATILRQKSTLITPAPTPPSPKYPCEAQTERQPGSTCPGLRSRLGLPALSYSRGLQRTGPVRLGWPGYISINSALDLNHDGPPRLVRAKTVARTPLNNPRSRCLSSTYRRLSSVALSLRRERAKDTPTDHALTSSLSSSIPRIERHVTFVRVTYRAKNPSAMLNTPRKTDKDALEGIVRDPNTTAPHGSPGTKANIDDDVSPLVDPEKRRRKKLTPINNRSHGNRGEADVSINSSELNEHQSDWKHKATGRALPMIRSKKRRNTYPESAEQVEGLSFNALTQNETFPGSSTSYSNLNAPGTNIASPRVLNDSVSDSHQNPSNDYSSGASKQHSSDILPSQLQKSRLKPIEPLRQTNKRKPRTRPKRLQDARIREPMPLAAAAAAQHDAVPGAADPQEVVRNKPLELAKLEFNRERNRGVLRAAQSVGLTAEQANDLYYTRDSKILSNVYIEKLNKLAFGSDSESELSDD